VTNPGVEHIESGSTLRFNIIINRGSFLDIDLRNKTVVLDGSASRRFTLDPSSRWFSLQPGNNNIRFTGIQHIPYQPYSAAADNLALNPGPNSESGWTAVSGEGNTATQVDNFTRRPNSSSVEVLRTAAGAGVVGRIYRVGSINESSSPTILRTNLCTNPSVEVDLGGFDTFAAGGSVSLTRETGDTPSGTHFARATWLTDGTNTEGGVRWSDTAAVEGQVFGASAMFRTGTDRSMRLIFQWIDALGAQISVSPSAGVTPAGDWTLLDHAATAPAGTASVRLIVYGVSGSGAFEQGETVDVDSVLLRELADESELLALGEFFSGSTAASDLGDITYEWSGAENDSTSFEMFTPQSTGLTPVVEDISYVFSVYGTTNYTAAGPILLQLEVFWLDAEGEIIESILSEPVPVGSSVWQRTFISGVAPTGAVMAAMSSSIVTEDPLLVVPAGAKSWFQDAMVTEGDSMIEYFDGTFSQARWDGAVGGSISRRVEIPGVPRAQMLIAYRSAWIE
jgi:hypothetical protein